MRLFKYSGAGNDFLLADGRKGGCEALLNPEEISRLCALHHTDGLMILEESASEDFRMVYFNPDGSGGMMCGNGGRCIVAFASFLGIVPEAGEYVFEAPDGLHRAGILGSDGAVLTVRLKMKDVAAPLRYEDGLFLDTGTRHFVVAVDDVDKIDVDALGRTLRHDPRFAPVGTNVNFVSQKDGRLFVRTFEKGVEGETLACGTGIVASAIATFVSMGCSASGNVRYGITARRGDSLFVDFTPVEDGFREVYLTGPAEQTDIIEI